MTNHALDQRMADQRRIQTEPAPREFRARLRPSNPAIWMDRTVESLGVRLSAKGAYVLVRFSDCPYLCTLGQSTMWKVRQAMRDRGLDGEVIRVGDRVNLDIRWRNLGGACYPDVRLDFAALLAQRQLEADLIDRGRP